MGDPKWTAKARVDNFQLTADNCNRSAWVVLKPDAIRIAEAHAAAATAEARERIRELEAEVQRLRVLRPWAEPFVPTTMLAIDKAFSLAELMYSRDVQIDLDTQMRAMVVRLRAAFAKEVRP